MVKDRLIQKVSPIYDIMHTKKSFFLTFLLLVILTGIAYAPAFNSAFILDDHVLIETNLAIRDLKNIPLFFTSKEARVPTTYTGLENEIYRPLQSVSYAISYYFWKLDARMYRAENIAVHVVNGLLLYLLALTLFQRSLLAFFASLLFLVHPVQIEAVTYLSGRSDVLSLFFYLASLLLFIKTEYNKNESTLFLKSLSLLCFAGALLSKEMAATLPFIIVLYLFFGRPEKKKPSFAGILKATWIYFLVLFLFFTVRTQNLGQVAQTTKPLLQTILIMIKVFVGYLRLLLLPIRLTFFPVINRQNMQLDASLVKYVIIIAAFISLCFAAIKRDRRAAFLLFSFLTALLPVSNIIPLKTFMQERFLYFPSVFMLLFFSYVIVKSADALKKRKIGIVSDIPFYFLSAAVIFFMCIGFGRNRDWKDEITLVKKEIMMHPEYGRLYFDLGHAYFQKKDYGQSEYYLKKALHVNLIASDKARTFDRLGNICMERKQFDEALRYYHKAVEADSSYVFPLNALGDIYFKRKNYQKAKFYFKQAVALAPRSALYNRNLGFAHWMLGGKKNALIYWKKSLQIKPHQPTLRNFIAEHGK